MARAKYLSDECQSRHLKCIQILLESSQAFIDNSFQATSSNHACNVAKRDVFVLSRQDINSAMMIILQSRPEEGRGAHYGLVKTKRGQML